MRPEVLGGLGGFSGAFSLAKIKEMEEPVLLSGTDGCGTKVKLAMILDKHDTIGIDAVAMCVNDIACAGGERSSSWTILRAAKTSGEDRCDCKRRGGRMSSVRRGADRRRDCRASGADG